MNFTVSLGSNDLIVNAEAVGNYLMNGQIPDPVIVNDADGARSMKLESGDGAESWKTKKWSGKGLEIMWWPGFDHATVYSNKESSDELVRVLVEYSRRA